MMAAMLYLSMINNVKILYYFGFLRGMMSKAIFLLFCAALVFPMDGGCNSVPGCKDEGWINRIAGYILSIIALV